MMARPSSLLSTASRICNTPTPITNNNISTTFSTNTSTSTTTSMENNPLTDQDSQSTIVSDEKALTSDIDTLSKGSVSNKQPLEDRLLDDMEMVMMTPSALQPLQMSSLRKWFILFIVALQGFLGPLSSSIYASSNIILRMSLGTSSTLINATISLYVFTQGIAPMMWAALSERYGRRIIYIIATIIYVGSTIGCALSPAIGIFVLMRIFQSIGASAAQAVGAGTITDLFLVHERGNAMGLFFLGPLIGPVVGPIAGGYIDQYVGWRYIFWTLAGMGGLVLLLMLFFLPETSTIILEQRKCQQPMLKAFTRPFTFLSKPVVLLASTPYALAYGFMYFVISSLPHQLGYRYQLSSSQIGLSYLANGVGNAVGAVLSGKQADWLLRRKQRETGQQQQEPEIRLAAMWLGIILLPIGELMYGWCIYFNVHVAAGLAGLFILGVGVGVVQTPSNTYLVDAYNEYSASVIGASNLLRSTCAGCTPLMAPAMLKGIGNGWSMTVFAIISILSGGCIYFVQLFGQRWRTLHGP
ncbi:major facilitator superfamily domain-containing protein [Phascolomyces articulosus]|uniref:Major facilitator superfamily domain-containing protein n=1 Tax=Phascolomyces articulosus TaxID=60185 RepID=A0AAD5K528_9FUNG|nr:major facilitator superfamily domain-containing protein [Phascolomyces articulosus]